MNKGLQAIKKLNNALNMEYDKEEIGDGFQLRFVGKSYAKYIKELDTETMLVPDVDWNKQEENKNSENVFITGDNLEALKHLQKAYSNKIKLIYIDPPYNTGSDDFVYKDNFNFSDKELEEKLGLSLEEIERVKSLKGKSSHSAWLTFMYPRLALAKRLLTEDGVIFISIDDNEQANLKLICDEIFGEDNFEADFHIKVRHENRMLREDIRYQLVIEHTLCYRKAIYSPNRREKNKSVDNDYCYDIQINNPPKQVLKIGGYDVERYNVNDYEKIKRKDGEGALKEYQIRGSLITQKGSASEYYEENLRQRRTIDEEGTLYKVIGMGVKGDGLGYRFIRQPYDYNFKNGFYYQGKPLSDVQSKGLPFVNFYDFTNEMNRVGLEGNIDFKNGKKPIALIKKFFEIAKLINNDDIILDFFAGSATTAHAVMELNKEDGGSRKYIMVQLDEPVKENSEAEKNGYKTIDEISRQRIINAAEKLGDTSGFKHYKIASVSDTKILAKIEEFDPTKPLLLNSDKLSLNDFSGESLNTDLSATGEDTILTTWLLADGFAFNVKIKELKIKDYIAYSPDEYHSLYFINEGWSSAHTKEFLNMIGKRTQRVNTIYLYNHSFDFTNLTELKNNLRSVLDAEKQINIIERF